MLLMWLSMKVFIYRTLNHVSRNLCVILGISMQTARMLKAARKKSFNRLALEKDCQLQSYSDLKGIIEGMANLS